MNKWFARSYAAQAKREAQAPVTTADRVISAVTAVSQMDGVDQKPLLSTVLTVPQLQECIQDAPPTGSNGSGLPAPLSLIEQAGIQGWFQRIGETDLLTMKEILDRCQLDEEVRQYFLTKAKEFTHDDCTH